MDILFLDANVLFSAAYQEKAGIQQLWKIPQIKLITSAYAAAEARRNLKTAEQIARLDQLLTAMQVIAVEYTEHLFAEEKISLPDKDKPIFAAAVAAKATYLITGDFKDFGCYFGQTIADITILPPAKYFLKISL